MATKTVETGGAPALAHRHGEDEDHWVAAQSAPGEIPEAEAWLYNNPEARETVLSALERLGMGRFSDSPPDVDAPRPWLEQIED